MFRNFTWIPIYQELAQELTRWENKQAELISFLEELRLEGFVITPLHDKDGDGRRSLLREIDPFTFFGVFNRRITYEQRLGILTHIKSYFQLESELPDDFDGIPLLSPMRSWFFSAQPARRVDDVRKLWHVFRL